MIEPSDQVVPMTDARSRHSDSRSLAVHLYPSAMTTESWIMRITGIVAQLGIFDEVWMVGTSVAGRPDEEVVDARRRVVRLPRPYKPPRGLMQRIINTQAWSRGSRRV
jgi:hypothetical protein